MNIQEKYQRNDTSSDEQVERLQNEDEDNSEDKDEHTNTEIESEDGTPVAKKIRVDSERPTSNPYSSSSSSEDLNESAGSGPVFCVIDLETTSLKTPDLTQISGQTLDGRHTFNVFILPNKLIDPKAGEITGMKKVNNQLVVRGKTVKTVNITQALNMFADWLDSLDADVILVGHNVRKFDLVHLSRHAREQNLGSRFQRVVGTLDTALLFANLHPYARPHTLARMYRMFFQTSFEGAHGAVEDCRAVARILNEGSISDAKKEQFIQEYSF